MVERPAGMMVGQVPSARLARVALALFLTGLGLSACGGEERSRPAEEGSTSASQRVTPKTIERCLKQAQICTSRNVDPIAKEAGVGALAAVFPGNYVNIAVERTVDEASSTMRAYEESAKGPRMRLEQTGAVVAAYANTPTSQQKQSVSRCVKGT